MGSIETDTDSQRLAAEVLELGESLFEAALEVRGEDVSEVEVVEEIRAARDEFFVALRMLLKVR